MAGKFASLSAAVLLTRGTTAQTQPGPCMDMNSFAGDQTMNFGFGGMPVCQDWLDTYIEFFEAFDENPSMDTCNDMVEVVFENVTGHFRGAFWQLQKAMAEEGCCSGDMDFPCMGYLKQGPCEGEYYCTYANISDSDNENPNETEEELVCTPYVEDSGACAPCYMNFTDGECLECWGMNAKGCSREECEEHGTWDGEKCHLCNSENYGDCGEQACTDLGKRWMCNSAGYDCKCADCDPNGLWDQAAWGCSEEECDGEYHAWTCYKDECYCTICDVTGEHGWMGDCPREMCASDEHPDVQWIEYEDGHGECARCTAGDGFGLYWGCTNQTACQSAGARWMCDDSEEKPLCCRQCDEHDVGGCWSESECNDHDGNWWCDESGMKCECLPCRHDEDDVWGCLEHQCHEERDHHWTCAHGECRCRHCDLTAGRYIDAAACPESMCLEEYNLDWRCSEGECRCTKCDLMNQFGGWVGYCGQEVCESAAHTRWISWGDSSGDDGVANNTNDTSDEEEEDDENTTTEDEHATTTEPRQGQGMCLGCFMNSETYEYAGCNYQQCEDMPGFEWHCAQDDTSPGCCEPCMAGNFYGCKEEHTCQAAGGQWCEDYASYDYEQWCSHECPSACANVETFYLDNLRMNGFRPISCSSNEN